MSFLGRDQIPGNVPTYQLSQSNPVVFQSEIHVPHEGTGEKLLEEHDFYSSYILYLRTLVQETCFDKLKISVLCSDHFINVGFFLQGEISKLKTVLVM